MSVHAQVLGGVFMGLQGLASQGIITINWGRTTEIFGQYADVNRDGKVDKADAEAAIKELQVRTSLHSQLRPLCVLSLLREGATIADTSSSTESSQARLTKDMGPAAGGFGTGFLLGLRYG